MHIITPDTIEVVAWEGELEPPESAYSPKGALTAPVVTLGRPEIYDPWEQEKLLGRPWTPPLGDARYWLVRLACSLRKPADGVIAEAEQRLLLQPDRPAPAAEIYAHSLYPDRQTIEEPRERTVKIGPELKIATVVDGSLGEASVTVGYKKVFPVIQSYDAGTPYPYWRFHPHAAFPLEGTQFVYAVVAARPAAVSVQAAVEVVVTLETRFGPLRFGAPEAARKALAFKIP